ncbi:MAG: hypothetical protein H6815_04470 [Phycisphaeraceae bacterium]|nr:hypothetical protein [Phycisphaerales bacterium]MCB9859687.1 hypothetical protein [Phycisphaeraceae bacterium]
MTHIGRWAAILVLSGWCGYATAQVEFRTVTLGGTLAPGLGGLLHANFAQPALNAGGYVGFSGGVSANPDECLWTEGAGTYELLAREEGVAPGTGGAMFSTFYLSTPVLNDAGQTAFLHSLSGTGVTSANNSTIWMHTPGGEPEVVVREGDTAPGTGGDLFGDLSFPRLNSSGSVSFYGLLTGSSTNASVWSNASGSMTLLARSGSVMTAPGTGGATFFSLTEASVSLNDTGTTVFHAELDGTGVNGVNDEAIFSNASGSLDLVVRGESVAPGTGGAMFFNFVTSVGLALNNDNDIAFRCGLTGTGVTSSNNSGIWSTAPGSLSLVVREGDVAPGTGGATFSGFGVVKLNGTGNVMFTGFLTGSGVTSANDAGVWIETSSGIELVVREGDAAPDAGGATFGNGSGSFSFDPVWNAVGQVAFLYPVTGSGVSSSNDMGLWMTDEDGEIVKVVREGDVLDVNSDPVLVQTETIWGIRFFSGSGGQDGRIRAINDDGDIAYQTSFAPGDPTLVDGGVFVANVPPPVVSVCYADCDGNGTLTIFDYICFGTAYAAGSAYADCDGNGVFTIFDYICFGTAYAAGCP